MNFIAGQTVANEATIALGDTGDANYGNMTIYNFTGSTDVVVDVQGYYAPNNVPEPDPFLSTSTSGGMYNAVTDHNTGTNHPVRVLDTRPGSGQQGAGETIGPDQTLSFLPGTGTFPFNTPAVPSDATAVVLNVTAATSTADSFLTVWATGGSQPLASNLNFPAGKIVPNRVIVPIDPTTKQVSIFNAFGNTDVVVDLDGFYTPNDGSLYFPLVTPSRIVDTRPGSGAPYSGQTLGTGTILTTNVPGDNFPPVTGFTAPADFTGFDVNTTITDTTGNGGYLTQYPSNAGSTPPLASDLNWNAGAIVSNANQLSSGGVPDIAIDNFNFTGNADLVIDLYGYFGKAPGHIYWAKDDGTITRANLDGTNPQTIVTGQSGPVGVAVDSAHIYWANFGDGTIDKANLDGSNPQTIVTGQNGPEGVAVDSAHIYWANGGDGTIIRANLDGTSPQTIVTGQDGGFAPGPVGVAVDSAHIYWANNANNTIDKANLDGSSPQAIVTGQNFPVGVAVDSAHIYWANSLGSTIDKANLDGSSPQAIVTGQSEPYGLAVDSAHVYWDNFGNNTIDKANLDGSNPQAIVTGQLEPEGVAVGAG